MNGKQEAIAPRPPMPMIAMEKRGLVLTSFDEAIRFANAVTKSGFAPKGMNEAGVLIAIEMGAELGLPPMAALQNIAVINGRPSVWGDAIPAICMASGVFDLSVYRETIEYHEESGFPMSATCTVRRLPDGPLTSRTFTIDNAKRARLLDKEGPWSQYPARMLQMRARSWAMRDAFPDLLRGFHVSDRLTGEMVDGPPDSDIGAPVVEQLDDNGDDIVEQTQPPTTLDELTAQMPKPTKKNETAQSAQKKLERKRAERAAAKADAPTPEEMAEDEKKMASGK